jgi:hypothetical protein
MEFKVSLEINASPEQIWIILTNLAEWPLWDPYCDRVEGELALGEKIKVFTKLSPGRAFPVRVVELIQNERMTWQAGMPFGLFKGVRTYTLVRTENGRVLFKMHEVFSGPLLGLIGKSIPDMTDAFQKFAVGLKERAERI